MTSYELKQKTKIEELGIEAVELVHKKTGAKVFLLPCEDDNKAFAIGFRTTPMDSTGVAHIIEHTVLCGSGKYPCKDPFIELAKGSLNTFLNAMTYPDKTVYPVASCNDKDFDNLMSVYLDAVFDPNIYREIKIFEQEGWHYELDSIDGELSYNGVVYNEMKGVYSSSDGILERETGRLLFEGHTYGADSGGDPDYIPALTYEEYLDFHRKYYHPSNAYIYLYGNCDMDEKLEKIDREYLSRYDYLKVDSEVPLKEGWTETKEKIVNYPILDSEDEDNTAILTLNTLVGGALDPVKYMGMQILDYMLLSVPGAPLREALIDAGIGEDVSGGYMTEILMPYFSVVARNTSIDKKDEFLRIIRETLSDLAANGLDHQGLLAAINVFEFKCREADFGSFPKGLAYGLQAFESWLYDADPTINLKYSKVFAELRQKAEEGYFEELIKECLLNNKSQAVLCLKPEKGLTAKNDQLLKDKLAQIKNGMTEEELEKIVQHTRELKAYQSEPSSEEDLNKIPLLKREDISKDIIKYPYEVRTIAEHKCVYSDVFTSKIAYLKLMYEMNDIDERDVAYTALLADVIGYIDTQEHTYAELATLTNLNSGGIGFSVEAYANAKDARKARLTFSANAKVLYDKVDFAFDAMSEMLYESRLSDVKRLKDIVAEVRARTRESIQYSGHQTALNKAGSHLSKKRWFDDAVKGIGYYRFLEKLEVNEDLSKKLQSICDRIFNKRNLTVNIICDEEGYKICEEVLAKAGTEGRIGRLQLDKAISGPADGNKLDDNRAANSDDADGDAADKEVSVPAFAEVNASAVKKEAYVTAGMVNFVARFGDFRAHGFDYDGALNVLRTLMNYEYLWNNIRVLGGAYGCSSIFGVSGAGGFTSYRDPNLTETNVIYDGIAEYAGGYEADEREMTKAVIGTISGLDSPSTPYSKGSTALAFYMSDITDESRQKIRDEILTITPEKIRALKPLLEAMLSDGYVCALACQTKVEESREFWDEIQTLVKN